jgi:hypothetical protein
MIRSPFPYSIPNLGSTERLLLVLMLQCALLLASKIAKFQGKAFQKKFSEQYKDTNGVKNNRDVLLDGGNAVDAAIATLLCVGVVQAQSMGVGGGFLGVIYNATEQTSYVCN